MSSTVLIYLLFTIIVNSNVNTLKIEIEGGSEVGYFVDIIKSEKNDQQPIINIFNEPNRRLFAVSPNTGSVTVKASLGPINVKQTIYPSLMKSNLTYLNKQPPMKTELSSINLNGNEKLQIKLSPIYDDLNAYLVTKEISRDNPLLRVLFHINNSPNIYHPHHHTAATHQHHQHQAGNGGHDYHHLKKQKKLDSANFKTSLSSVSSSSLSSSSSSSAKQEKQKRNKKLNRKHGSSNDHLVNGNNNNNNEYKNELKDSANIAEDNDDNKDDQLSLCAIISIEKDDEMFFASCIPSSSSSASASASSTASGNPKSLKNNVCLAEITLPSYWWPTLDIDLPKRHKSSTLSVKYGTIIMNKSNRNNCNNITGSVIDRIEMRTLDQQVQLQPYQGSYEEVTSDDIVRLLIPQRSLYRNSKLYIPVCFHYNPNYPLVTFTIRAKVRNGLRIIGAQVSSKSPWEIRTEINNKQNVATVMAKLKEDQFNDDGQVDEELLSSLSSRSQEIYTWLFEVNENIDGYNDIGRIVWQISYNSDRMAVSSNDNNNNNNDGYLQTEDSDNEGAINNGANVFIPPSVENVLETSKLTTKLDIEKDDIQEIIAITRTSSILNTAILNGKQITMKMIIYAITESGEIGDITKQAICKSLDETIIKVSSSCTSVYLDGTEIRGSINATITIKYGTYVGTKSLQVWLPKLPVQIYVSDERLSLIKNWHVPYLKRHIINGELNEPNDLNKNDGANLPSSENVFTCKKRYQQTYVKVYGRYYSSDHNSGREVSYINRQIYLDITDLVSSFIYLSNRKLAQLHRNNIIEGLAPGKLNIIIKSPINGEVLGKREITIDGDSHSESNEDNGKDNLDIDYSDNGDIDDNDYNLIKKISKKPLSSANVKTTARSFPNDDQERLVEIDNINVNLITGLSMIISPYNYLENIWLIDVKKDEKLIKKYQEGLLDIKVKYSDNTFTYLSDIIESDYHLGITTEQHQQQSQQPGKQKKTIKDLPNESIIYSPILGLSYPRIILIKRTNLMRGKSSQNGADVGSDVDSDQMTSINSNQFINITLEIAGECLNKQNEQEKVLAKDYINLALNYNQHMPLIIQNDANEIRKNYNHQYKENEYYRKQYYEQQREQQNYQQQHQYHHHQNPSGFDYELNNKRMKLNTLSNANINIYPLSVKAKQNRFVYANTTPLQIGMYCFLGVFTLALTSCMIFAVRYRGKKEQQQSNENQGATGDSTQARQLNYKQSKTLDKNYHFSDARASASGAEAQNWVWLGKSTIERSSSPLTTKDINGNPVITARGTEIRLSNNGSDNNGKSQRVSTISYPGSEISIRITTNPVEADDSDVDGKPEHIKPLIRTTSSKVTTVPPPPPVPKHSNSIKLHPKQILDRRHHLPQTLSLVSTTLSPTIMPTITTIAHPAKEQTRSPQPPIPPHRKLSHQSTISSTSATSSSSSLLSSSSSSCSSSSKPSTSSMLSSLSSNNVAEEPPPPPRHRQQVKAPPIPPHSSRKVFSKTQHRAAPPPPVPMHRSAGKTLSGAVNLNKQKPSTGIIRNGNMSTIPSSEELLINSSSSVSTQTNSPNEIISDKEKSHFVNSEIAAEQTQQLQEKQQQDQQQQQQQQLEQQLLKDQQFNPITNGMSYNELIQYFENLKESSA